MQTTASGSKDRRLVVYEAVAIALILTAAAFLGFGVFRLGTSHLEPESQLAAVDGAGSGLVGWWKLDDASGTTAADSSGNGYSASLHGSPAWSTGQSGSGSISLNGSSQWISVPNASLLNTASMAGLTLSAWVNFSDLSSWPVIFEKTGSYELRVSYLAGDNQGHVDATIYYPDNSRCRRSTDSQVIQPNAWYLVTAVFSGTSVGSKSCPDIYVNGALVSSSGSSDAGVFDDTTNLGIGRRPNSPSEYLSGIIDDARIYGRPLSALEVQGLYSSGPSSPTSVQQPQDTVPPALSYGSPSGQLAAGTASASLSVTSNENATCKYSQTAGTTYSSMTSSFSATGGTNHSTAVSGLQNATSYTYYVRCIDSSNNADTSDYPISFSVAAAQQQTQSPPTQPQSQTQINWYVSPQGSASGDGSIANPWDLQTALNQPATVVKPGDTVWLRGGTYGTGGSTQFANRLQGTQAASITVRQYPGERAIVDGGIGSSGPWTTFWGFEITNTSPLRKVDASQRLGGLNFYAPGDKSINMVIHDVGHPGIGIWTDSNPGPANAMNAEVYGNLLWGNGLYDLSDPRFPDGWTRGQGIYSQNLYGTVSISDNISFKNFTGAMKQYSENGHADGFSVTGNIMFNNNEYQYLATTVRNPIQSLTVSNNFLYMDPGNTEYPSQIGYASTPQIDQGTAVFTNNYFVQGGSTYGALDIYMWQNLNMVGNTFVSQAASYLNPFVNIYYPVSVVSIWMPGVKGTYVWQNNHYYGGGGDNHTVADYGSAPLPFMLSTVTPRHDQMISFDAWNTLVGGTGQGNTYSQALPTANVIAVRPNKYEAGRGNIVVYNWENRDTVSVNISSLGLATGDTFEVRDVQNYLGAPVLTGTYSGSAINLPMNLTTITPLVGSQNITSFNPNTHTPKTFNAFVVLKTGGSVQTPATLPQNGSSGTGANTGTTGGSTEGISGGNLSPVMNMGGGAGGGSAIVAATQATAASTGKQKQAARYTFSKWLSLGSADSEVKILQQTLNANGYAVSASGTGSAGNESIYFGPATAFALKKFQCATLNVCSGDPATTGYGATGPKTRAALSALGSEAIVGTASNAPIQAGIRFSRPLTVGSTGSDVKALQVFLNAHGYPISSTGAGSPGNESTYFGLLTKQALIRFQDAYASEILAPAGLTSGTGYFGEKTMQKVNALNAQNSHA